MSRCPRPCSDQRSSLLCVAEKFLSKIRLALKNGLDPPDRVDLIPENSATGKPGSLRAVNPLSARLLSMCLIPTLGRYW